MKRIIAIVGMCGSGKSVASDMLEEMGWSKVYFGGVTMEKLKEEGLEVNPENEKMMRERLRSELGMGAYAKVLLPRILSLAESNDTVLDGLYSWDEYKILTDSLGENLTVVAVVTDKEKRYSRLEKREIRPLTRMQASKRDFDEIENIAKAGPIAIADYYIDNNGSILEYKDRFKEILDIIESR